MQYKNMIVLWLAWILTTGMVWADEIKIENAKPAKTSQSSSNEQFTNLDDMVVTASRIEEKQKETTANVLVIDKIQIENSPAKDLGELLAQAGIGYIKKYPGASTVIGLRGFKTDTFGDEIQGHVLIMINGRRAGTGNAAKIITRNIERIEIIRGPASVQYGSAAMGGIVNVVTKKGGDVPHLSAEGIVGSNGYQEANADLSGKLTKIDFAFDTMISTSDDYMTANRDKYANTGYGRKENLNLNIGFEFLPKNRIGVVYNGYKGVHIGLPEYLSQQDLDDYKDSSLNSFDISYEGSTFSDRYHWTMRYFQTQDKETDYDPITSNPSGYDDGIATQGKDDQKGGQVQGSLSFANTVITSGCDWVHYDVESDYSPELSEYDNLAFFGLSKSTFLQKKLILTGGIRYDLFRVKIIEPAGNTESIDNLSPRIGAAYLIKEDIKLRATYGQAFAFPSAKELAYDYLTHSSHYKGNPNLEPEKSQTYEIGVDFSRHHINSSVTYFFTRFKDKIQTVPQPNSDLITWENLGRATLEGVEGAVSCDIGYFLNSRYEIRPYFNFTWMTRYEDEQTHTDLIEISGLEMAYGLSITDYDGFSAGLNFTYTGQMTITDYESGYPYQDIEKDSFVTANLSISKKLFKIKNAGEVQLKSQITNLLDQDYSYVNGYPMPGRSFYVGLGYDY